MAVAGAIAVDPKEFEAAFEPIFREEFGRAYKDVGDGMKMARGGVKNGDKVVQYTQGQHNAIHLTLAGLQARVLSLLRIHKQEREKLEARIAVLEGRPELKDAGPWKEGKQYREGEVVSYQGSAWICRKDTKTRPAGSPSWRLLVKRGKDAAK